MKRTTTDPGLVARLLRLIEFSDSALPVGGFSFSGGVETAIGEGLVRDAETLEAYVQVMVEQGAACDGVAALEAHRGVVSEDWTRAYEADRRIWLCKAGEENRRMSCRMGHKLTELAERIYPCVEVQRWCEALRRGEINGCYPSTQGLLFAAVGLGEEALFAAYAYGVANPILSAALRLMRITHFATQQILFRLAPRVESLYEQVRDLSLEEMHLFAPEADWLASLHEQGERRIFMN